ncbi:hypothetical protein [Thiofilum flexile]|uniref:hypothetical protein n=1 Tax=Thiofilum flexile TaxID=125627 RepID=UPI00036DE85A|nr:hypothetical protein [Thiofilum flexile]
MDATHYSLLQASLEIIGLILLMFLLGILACTLLRRLGICCRNTNSDEPSLFTLKEPAAFDFDASSNKPSFDAHPTFPLNGNMVPNNNELNRVTRSNNPAPMVNPQHNRNIPPAPIPQQELPPAPSLEVELPTPTATTITKPELPPVTVNPIAHTDATERPVANSNNNSGYVVDIETLLRRKPEEPPTATIAAASKHHGIETTARSPALSTVSIAELLNTQADLIDNLRKLEGITPRIEALLNEAGIKSYQALSQQTPQVLRQILIAAGEPFKQIDPQTWPFQAELASKGEWARLQDYQGYLKNNPI